jgi:twitching motility protein PilT
MSERPRIDDLLEIAVEAGASDLHLAAGQPPLLRVMGEIVPLRMQTLLEPVYDAMLSEVVPPDLWERFRETGDLDWAYDAAELGRFRVNLFRQERGPAAVFRHVPSSLLGFEDLGLPPQVSQLVEYPNGLVLVTGPTGSGKSTTLAALIEHLNRTRRLHVLTIEDPIEHVHANRLGRITQREIGSSAPSFAEALRLALREDPDVILVGELRDLETITMALQAAETGILVLATLHTNSASRSVDRLVNVFPAGEQEMVRGVLAGVLKGILAQQLLPRRSGGRVPAVELLFWTTGLPAMVRDGKAHLVETAIKSGRSKGMISMDDSLMDLVRRREVEPKEAFDRALDRNLFRKNLSVEFNVTV